ncbi:hypothetical protein [Lacticaseibacillus daqingensis]|uniref:hypothetical protein n=1 Tax=Lacticaseibacillus daqingensis TaxID=2486014 RepID=UPI000F7B4C6E|nr:hypothetical protein [Lacticaseibacillus daqingensis]
MDIYSSHENQQEALDNMVAKLLKLMRQTLNQAIEQGKDQAALDVSTYHKLVVEQAVATWREEYPLDEMTLFYINDKPDGIILRWWEAVTIR